MSNFHVGQKVVCIDDLERDEMIPGVSFIGDLDGLRKGSVYTIRSVFFSPVFGEPLVRLNEIQRLPLCRIGGFKFEGGYDPSRFRPVAERRTDISIFRAMLEPKKARADA